MRIDVGVGSPVVAAAVSATIIGVVAAGRDDPSVPADVAKSYVKLLLATLVAFRQRAVDGPATDTTGDRRIRMYHQEGFLPFVGLPWILEQHRGDVVAATGALDQQPEPVFVRRRVPLLDRARDIERFPTETR